MITLHMGCFNKEIIFYGEKNIENSHVTYCGPGELEKIFILLGINLHRYSNKIIRPCLWSPLIKETSKKNHLKSCEITALGLNPQGEEIFFNKIFSRESPEISHDSEISSNINFFKNIKMLAMLICQKGLFKPGISINCPGLNNLNVKGPGLNNTSIKEPGLNNTSIKGPGLNNLNIKEPGINSDMMLSPENNLFPQNSPPEFASFPGAVSAKWFPLLDPGEQDFFWRIIESAPFRLFSFTSSRDKKPSRFVHFYEAEGILEKFINQIINSSSSHAALSDEISKNILSPHKYAGFDHIIYNLKKGPDQNYSDLAEHNNLRFFLNSSNRFNRASKIFKKQIFPMPGPPLKFSLRLDIDREKNEWTLLLTAKERKTGGRILNFDTLWEKIHSSKSINFLGMEFQNTQILKFIVDSLNYLLSLTDEILKTCHELPGAQEFYKDLCLSLKKNRPEKIILKPESAYFFLKTASIVFQNRGIGLFMPSWWLKKARAGISVSMKPLSGLYAAGGSVNNYSGLFDVDWKITVNGQEVSAEELEEMARQKLPFIKFRDNWIEVNTKQLKETLKFLKKASLKMTLTDAMKLSLEKSGTSDNRDSVHIDTDGWLKRILSRLSNDKSSLQSDAPLKFSGTLRPYQIKGLAWLEYLNKIGLGACLADDMGLGKTVQALALIQKNINSRKNPNRAC